MKQAQHPLLYAAVAVIVSIAGCAAPAPAVDYDAALQQMMKSSFRDQGIAKVDRLQQDEADAACSKALGAPLPEATRVAIEAEHPMSWYEWVGSDGVVLGLTRFGASAKYERIYEELGLTVDRLVQSAVEVARADEPR